LKGKNPELLANQKGQKRQIPCKWSGFFHAAKFYKLLNKFNKITQFLRPPTVLHLSQIISNMSQIGVPNVVDQKIS
jgi:hypothetical protein